MALTTPPRALQHTPSSPHHETDLCHLTSFQNLKALSFFGSQTIFSIMIKQIPLISFKSWYVTEPGFEHELSDFRAHVVSCWYPLQPITGLQCLLLSDADDYSAKPTLSAGRLLHFIEGQGEVQEERKSEPRIPRWKEQKWKLMILLPILTTLHTQML